MYITGTRFDNGKGVVEDYKVIYDTQVSPGETRTERVKAAIVSALGRNSSDSPQRKHFNRRPNT